MKSTEIKHNVENLIDNFSKEEFVFDLLVAYGISKTSVTRLKKETTIYPKLMEKYYTKENIL